MSDWLDELEPDARQQWDEFVDHFRREALGGIAGSGAFLAFVPSSEHWDVKFSAELGTAILLDKPLFVIAPSGVDTPAKLRKIADVLVEDADIDTTEGQEAIARGVERLREMMPE